MATFRTYAKALRPDHPLVKIHNAALTWRPSRYRSAEIERDMRAEPGVVLADVLQRTGGVYETTTRLTPKFREDIREIAELTSDDRLLGVAELAEVPVSLEHLRHVAPQTRILIGYRLDVTPAESPRLRRKLGLPLDPTITLHFDEVPFPDTPGKVLGRYAPGPARRERQRPFGHVSPMRLGLPGPCGTGMTDGVSANRHSGRSRCLEDPLPRRGRCPQQLSAPQ